MSEPIETTREELRKALKLWYEDHGERPDDFEPNEEYEDYSGAVDTLLDYLEQAKTL